MTEPTAQPPQANPALALQDIIRELSRRFLGKDEIARLVAVSAVAGEHMVIIGPPGTAKSALIRAFASFCDARYFEYLLTRFTEPNELFGPVDMSAFREGRYERRLEGMLPEAEIVFLDEIFKANSAILNTLLTILNERRFVHGGRETEVPLVSVFGASNEVPGDEALDAIFDRFLLRVHADNLESYQFQRLLKAGLALEQASLDTAAPAPTPLLSAGDLRRLRRALGSYLEPDPELVNTYKQVIFQLRGEGIAISDRRAIKLLKLCAAHALVSGREAITPADLAVLKHTWNNLDQRDIIAEAIDPVLEQWFDAHPDERGAEVGASLEDLAAELDTIRATLTGPEALPDVQLFSQLASLQDLRVALMARGGDDADALVSRIDQLLESVFQGG